MIKKSTIVNGVETVEQLQETATNEPTAEENRATIISQLSSLDGNMPRGLEDLIVEQMRSGYQPYEGQLEIIRQKQQLRAQLCELG